MSVSALWPDRAYARLVSFTYAEPDARAFLHTMRKVLESANESDLAALLVGAQLEFQTTGTFSRRRWDAYWTTVVLRVRADQLARYTDKVKARLLVVADSVMPPEIGYDLMEISIGAVLEAPPDEDQPMPGPTFKPERLIKHDELHFRSKTETRIYDALKKRNVLFFANATAVLGGKNIKREPDFLICKEGRWGILEVMGEAYHPAATAMRDHDRARLFKDYGIAVIEFYDAARCYNAPEDVVTDFLARLG